MLEFKLYEEKCGLKRDPKYIKLQIEKDKLKLSKLSGGQVKERKRLEDRIKLNEERLKCSN